MKHIKDYIRFTESLKPSMFRPFVLEFNKTRYSDLFKQMKTKYSGDKNAYRVYIPLFGVKANPIKDEIVEFLHKNDYTLISYADGTCRKNGAKNQSKIGQILTRSKMDELLNKFISDSSRKNGDLSDLMVCISRHPYDIAGSDTDRNWTNCMTMATKGTDRIIVLEKDLAKLEQELAKLKVASFTEKAEKKANELELRINALNKKIEDYKIDGSNAYKLIDDVKGGSLISYLIKKDDKNIQNPIANLNIKPYQNRKNKKDIILLSDTRMYGQGMPEFKETVDKFLEEVNGPIKNGLYCLKDELYIDSHTMEYRTFEVPKTEIELIKLLDSLNIENYTIDNNMIVNVNGDVNISDMGIKEIPFKFGEITGEFNIAVNRLESLNNMPLKVGGDFNCSKNLLKSLDGCPKYIGGDLIATNNPIKNLDGIGDVVGDTLIDSDIKK